MLFLEEEMTDVISIQHIENIITKLRRTVVLWRAIHAVAAS